MKPTNVIYLQQIMQHKGLPSTCANTYKKIKNHTNEPGGKYTRVEMKT